MPLPQEFISRLKKIIPPENFSSVLGSFSCARPVSFRVNPFGDSNNIAELTSNNFLLRAVTWAPGAFFLENKSLHELQETESYKQSKIYVQGLSSLLPVLALDPRPGEAVLDLCAAPGGKATQIAGLMEGEGRFVANEKNRSRFFKLKLILESYAQPQGRSWVELSLRPGEVFGQKYPNTFDKILVDAPCSSEGRFRSSEPKTYRYWKLAKIREMARLQKMLLASAVRALRPGGRLVYSTCTFAPEENEAVVDWALKKFKEEIRIEPLSLDFLSHTAAGLPAWEGKEFDPALAHSRRIFPTQEMEGFFLCRLQKDRSHLGAVTSEV